MKDDGTTRIDALARRLEELVDALEHIADELAGLLPRRKPSPDAEVPPDPNFVETPPGPHCGKAWQE